MIALSLAALAAVAPYHYYATSGVVELVPAKVAALEVQDQARFDAALAKQPSVTVKPMYGKYVLLENPTLGLARTLADAGVVKRLAAYENEHGALFVSDGRVLARFDRVLLQDEVARRIKLAGGVSFKERRRGTYEIVAPSPEDALVVANKLHEEHLAIWAAPDFITQRKKHLVPDDTFFDDQWHHTIIASRGAWDVTEGSADIIIAIIDSGVDMQHDDLKGKLVSPRDALFQDNNPQPDANDAHGTSTAGLAGATTNNGLGVAGVCGSCSIMPIRIMSESGFGRESADVDAFEWAIDHGAQILSNSWGPASQSSVPFSLDDAIQEVADDAREGKGALIFFASGNDYRENANYELASHPLVIGVGATTYFDTKEDYSNWGAGLDITAPAASVTSDISGSGGYSNGDYTSNFSGTSAACPVAAGVAGLVLSVDPTLTRAQVQAALYENADKVDADDGEYDGEGFSEFYGWGRVNALRAVTAVSGGEVCQPVNEICNDGVDNDCDYVADADDTSCAPTETVVGAPCELNFHCGEQGTCLIEDYGYPEGYCAAGCSSACPGDGVCVQGQGSNICYDGCESVDDCREGYDCLLTTQAGDRTCQPSCKFLGCGQGEMCDEASGQCYHDGPIGAGGACTESVDCADNGRCLREDSWWGMPGGFCRVSCQSDDDCPSDTACTRLGQGMALCIPTCERVSDCREEYTCTPSESAGTGVCWAACTSNEDCDGDVCNEYGLCGDQTPPVVDEPELPPGVCGCDATTACDADCDCDPECKALLKEKDGCSQMDPSFLAALLGMLALARRRRVG